MAAEFGLSGASTTHPPTSRRDRDFAVSKRNRGRSGCLNCRRRRKKCDEEKPSCAKCNTRGESCEWDTRITFRLSGIGTYHPSMVQSRNLRTQNDYQIMNVTFDDGIEPTQHEYHESQEEIPNNSPKSSDEPRQWDVQARALDRNVHSLNDEQHLEIPLNQNGTLAQNSTLKDSSSQKLLKVVNLDSSSRFHPQHGLLNSRRLSQENRHQPIQDEENNVAFSTLLPQNRFSGPSNERTSLSSGVEIETEQGSMDNLENELGESLISKSSQFSALDYLTSQPDNVDFRQYAADGNEALNLPSQDSPDCLFSPFTSGLGMNGSPDMPSDSYSTPTHQNLHTTLYYHMVETARNTALTRHASPEPFAQVAPAFAHNTSPSSSHAEEAQTQHRDPGLRLQPLELVKMTKWRQFELWRNYLDEIAIWLDMFDNDRNFEFQIPLMAKSATHLHYSILALSARQMERKSGNQTYTESIGLYQEAIQLIVKELYTLDTSVIASCVLLCVLEMMSSSPRAWCRHLNGCAMLLEAAGINGVVGGVRQSLFWCFARMDVWGGFLEDTLTKIPTSRWFIPSGTMIQAVTHFKAGSGSHSYANYAVFLCASVVNVLSNRTTAMAGESSVRSTTYAARWKALFDLLEDWYNNRPEEMQPLLTYSPGSEGDSGQPFSVVLCGSSPAVNGNQLYHAAVILMLQNKPKGLRLGKSSKSILWHARQICGIAISNDDHGARINSLQPLWIAGRLMSHDSEHRAILKVLAELEKDTGWATAWRAEDLKDYWGDV